MAPLVGVVGDGFSPVALQAAVTVESGGVVDALEALAGGRVAVHHVVVVNVSVAHAPLARPPSPRLPEPAVLADLALASCETC